MFILDFAKLEAEYMSGSQDIKFMKTANNSVTMVFWFLD